MIRILEQYRGILQTNPEFAALKADFDSRVAAMKSEAKHVSAQMSNLFRFCEEVFPEGQEILILVTELTVSGNCVAFIGRYGCKEYFAHNKELLFYERQQEILSQLDRLEL